MKLQLRSSACRGIVVLMAALAVFFMPGMAAGQPAAPSKDREQRLSELEKQLETLRKEVEAMRKDAEKPATAATIAGLLSPDWVKSLKWRSIGPAAMGGRITAISFYEADPSTYFVATASGGLLKTINNGVTFEHQFDHEATVSIGDVCVAPSDRNIVWIGTGENNPRNSVTYGDGVYKSIDGGKSWKNMGLKGIFQTGRVIVHPKNPEIVYVGALGRLYGPNPERGLFKTVNGGQSWEKVLYVDDKTGVIDMVMHPSEPETLIVAMWERQRDEFDSHQGQPALVEGYDAYDPIKKWGPGSGIYKTIDGGKSFSKLTKGLPTSPMGRIGLDIYRKDPKTLFAIIDCQKIGMGTPPTRAYLGILGENAEGGAKMTQVTEGGPGAKAGLKTGDIIKSVDKKPVAGYTQLTTLLRSSKVGQTLAMEVLREGKTEEIKATLEDRPLIASGQERLAVAAMLGLSMEPVEGGLRVSRVFNERSADKAGVKEGDVIQEIEGKPVKQSDDLTELLRGRKDGDKLKLKVLREKETKELTLELVDPQGPANRTRPYNFQYGGQEANVQDNQGPNSHEYGGVYKSTDGGESWTRINSLNPRPMYFSQIRVDPSDDKYLYVLGIAQHRSSDGGKEFKADGGGRVHADGHALWIDPKDGRHMVIGVDGGFYVTYDRMDTWDHLNHLAIAQFYHVAVDSRQPYRVYGGLQDNGSWGGPSRTLDGVGAINEDWIVVSQGDGFVCRVDPFDPDLVYSESQDGAMQRRNLKTGERGSIRPRPEEGKRYRFNWNTPFILSSHNAGIYYAAGNYVFRSVKRGDDLRVISPEIARTGRGTGTAISESPRNPEVVWAGTDDGNLWITKDGGKNWANVADKVGLPGPRWVSTIEASRFEGAEGRAYVAFDAHRSNDDEPYVYVTEDYGQTWKSIRANLPSGSTRCLREDFRNANLLFCGTEFGAWASLDRGTSWTRLNNNLPTVAVHELAIHPTAGEMVAATHGRSLWVLDINPLRQMSSEVVKSAAHLYEPNSAIRWRSEPQRGSPFGSGHRRYIGDNPGRGVPIFYSLTKKAEKVSMKVVDYTGQTIRDLEVKNEPGLHQVVWDLTRTVQPQRGGTGRGGPGGTGTPGGFAGRGGGGGTFGGRGGRGGGGQPPATAPATPDQPMPVPPEPTRPPAPQAAPPTTTPAATQPPPVAVAPPSQAEPPSQARPAPAQTQPQRGGQGRGGFGGPGGGQTQTVTAGLYRVMLTVDGQELVQTVRVELDPTLPASAAAALEMEQEEEVTESALRKWRPQVDD